MLRFMRSTIILECGDSVPPRWPFQEMLGLDSSVFQQVRHQEEGTTSSGTLAVIISLILIRRHVGTTQPARW